MEFHLDQSILRGDPGRVSTGRLTAPLPTPCTRSTFLFVPATSTGAWSSEERNVPSTPAPCDVHGSLGALSSAAASDWSNSAGRGLSPPFAGCHGLRCAIHAMPGHAPFTQHAVRCSSEDITDICSVTQCAAVVPGAPSVSFISPPSGRPCLPRCLGFQNTQRRASHCTGLAQPPLSFLLCCSSRPPSKTKTRPV